MRNFLLLSNVHTRIKITSHGHQRIRLLSMQKNKNYQLLVQPMVGKRSAFTTCTTQTPNQASSKHQSIGYSILISSILTLISIIPAITTTTMCEEHKDTENKIHQEDSNEKDDDQEEYYNEEDERSCPFCRFFLNSPCKETFITWQQCVKV